MMGTCWMAIPYMPATCANIHVKELDGWRVLDAAYESSYKSGFCIVLAEKLGKYSRFTIYFRIDDFNKYNIREDKGIDLDIVNFTVLPNGLCVTVINDMRVEASFDNQKIKVVENPPFDSSMKLFHELSKVIFVSRRKLHSVRLK